MTPKKEASPAKKSNNVIVEAPSPRDLDISTVLNNSWEHFREHVGLMFGFAIMWAVPSVLISLIATINGESTEVFGFDLSELDTTVPFSNETELAVLIGGLFISYIFVVLLTITSTRAILHTLKTKQQLTLSEAWNMTRPVIWPVIIMSLLVSLIIAGGLILFIIPGIVLALWYMYAITIQTENPTMTKRSVLSRSKQLFQVYPALPIFWGLIMIALSIGLVIVTAPIIFLLELLPFIGTFVADSLSGALTLFGTIGFTRIYLHLSQAVPGEDVATQDIAATKSD